MNTTIGSFRPCCWEDVDDDCLLPALPDSLWCAKHTAWAQRGYDPGMDALNQRRNVPTPPPNPKSPIQNPKSADALNARRDLPPTTGTCERTASAHTKQALICARMRSQSKIRFARRAHSPHIANEDLRQRVNEISDIKSKRQAFLQANDEFGYPYHAEKR
jgi:hypothetical protein